MYRHRQSGISCSVLDWGLESHVFEFLCHVITGNMVKTGHRNMSTGPLWDLQPILFTDESRYCLDFTDHRAKVWTELGERSHDSKNCEHDRYGGGSIMVWGGISWERKTDLHVFQNGTITGEHYINETRMCMSNPTLVQLDKISSLWTIMPIHTAQGLLNATWKVKQSND